MIHRVVPQRFGQLVAYAYLGFSQRSLAKVFLDFRARFRLQRSHFVRHYGSGHDTLEFVQMLVELVQYLIAQYRLLQREKAGVGLRSKDSFNLRVCLCGVRHRPLIHARHLVAEHLH